MTTVKELLDFFKYLDRRGFLREDLQCNPEHHIEAYLRDFYKEDKEEAWHLQEKEDIYNAIKGWERYEFACLMKDGTTQRFAGLRDEDYEGNISTHIYGENDDYDNIDDIVAWKNIK